MIASENYIYTNSKRECNIEYYQYYRRADAKATILSVSTKGKSARVQYGLYKSSPVEIPKKRLH